MTYLVRTAFGLLVLLNVATQTMWIRLGAPSTDTIGGLATTLTGLGLHNDGPDENGMITATSPDCPRPVTVGLMNVNGVDDAVAADMIDPSNRPIYVYLGAMDQKPTRMELYKTWLRTTIEALIGHRAFRAPNHFVLATLPQQCPQLESLNWAALSP